VELVLVRNFSDNGKDEFTVRIRAHAQKITKQNGAVASADDDVVPFEEYWTFGRRDGKWKLKECLPPAGGARMILEENVDEGSSAQQMEWYYSQERAV
jgi:hypothetical protein